MRSNIDLLCENWVYKKQRNENEKEAVTGTLHIGINLHEIHVKTQNNWDICLDLMKVISMQKNIQSFRLNMSSLLKTYTPPSDEAHSLKKKYISDIIGFVSALAKNSVHTLQSAYLNFSNNPIDFSELEPLFKILKDNKITIKELNLGNTNIVLAEDIQALFASLYKSDDLECFSLKDHHTSAKKV